MTEISRYTAYSGNFTYSYIIGYDVIRQDKINAISYVRLYAQIEVTGANYISWSNGKASIFGEDFVLSNTYYKGITTVHTKDITCQHGSDGQCNWRVGGSINTSFLMNGYCEGDMRLPVIERYATITQHKLKKVSTTSAEIEFIADKEIDSVQYKIDSNYKDAVVNYNSNKTGGSYVINNLIPNKTYDIKTRVRSKVSGLWTESSSLNIKTSSKTVRLKINNNLKECTPYVVINGAIKSATMYIRIKNEWKRGI